MKWDNYVNNKLNEVNPIINERFKCHYAISLLRKFSNEYFLMFNNQRFLSDIEM